MTTIRDKKTLCQFVDHATPADRLRHSAGMGMGEPERLGLPIWPALILLLILLSAYAAPDLIAWARGDVPVVTVQR